jgi:hypothetical protein
VNVRAVLPPVTIFLQKFHANFGFGFGSDVMGERTVVATVASTSSSKVTADVTGVSVKVLAACATRTIPAEPRPIPAKLGLHNGGLELPKILFLDRAVVGIKLPSPFASVIRYHGWVVASSVSLKGRLHSDKAWRSRASRNTRLDRDMEERAKNPSPAILHPVKVAASLTALGVKKGAIHSTSTMTPDVITAKRASPQSCNNTWGGKFVLRMRMIGGHMAKVAPLPTRTVPSLVVPADLVGSRSWVLSVHHDLIERTINSILIFLRVRIRGGRHPTN